MPVRIIRNSGLNPLSTPGGFLMDIYFRIQTTEDMPDAQEDQLMEKMATIKENTEAFIVSQLETLVPGVDLTLMVEE